VRHALELVDLPDVGDPRQVVAFAEIAGQAGWDGLSVRGWRPARRAEHRQDRQGPRR